MLDLRPNCEMCDKDLRPDAPDARICSYECTFCADCVERVLHNVCPNCAGNFVPRPIRPNVARRSHVSVTHQPPVTTRRQLKHPRADIDALVQATKDIDPSAR